VLVGEPSVLLVGLLPSVHRALARVLDGEARDDDEHLAQGSVDLGLQHHPGQARVEGQDGDLRDLATVCREPLAKVGSSIGRRLDRLQLLQQPYAVSDLA